MAAETSQPSPSDRWIPFYIYGFFIALVLVLVPMCVIAIKTYTGTVTDNAYEKGLAYNHTLEADKRMKNLGWQGDLQVKKLQNGHIAVTFQLKDKSGRNLKNAEVELWLIRPTQAKLDQKSKMSIQVDGYYTTDIILPEAGLWDARVSARIDGQVYQLSKRVVL